MAFSLTGDAGCEYGGGVSCYGNTAGGPKQSFLGFMLYDRFWFDRRLLRRDLGGGKSTTRDATWSCCRRSTVSRRLRPPNSPTSRRHPGDCRTRRGTHPSRSTGCRSSTSRSAGSINHRRRTCRISPGRVELRLREETPVIRTFVCMDGSVAPVGSPVGWIMVARFAAH